MFNIDYMPKKILHRDQEKQVIKTAISGIMRKEKPFDLMITG